MIKKTIPLLPLRDIVVFPGMVAPLFVGRKLSVNALNHAMTDEKKIKIRQYLENVWKNLMIFCYLLTLGAY